MDRRISGLFAWGALALLIGIPSSDVLLRGEGTTGPADAALSVKTDGPEKASPVRTAAFADKDFNVPFAAETDAVGASSAASEDAPFTVIKTYSPRQVGPSVPYLVSNDTEPAAQSGNESSPETSQSSIEMADSGPVDMPGELFAASTSLPTSVAPVVVASLAPETALTDPAASGFDSSATALPYPRPRLERPVGTYSSQGAASSAPPNGIRPDNEIFFEDWSEFDPPQANQSMAQPTTASYQAYVAPQTRPKASWLLKGEDQQFLRTLPVTHNGLIRLDLLLQQQDMQQ